MGTWQELTPEMLERHYISHAKAGGNDCGAPEMSSLTYMRAKQKPIIVDNIILIP